MTLYVDCDDTLVALLGEDGQPLEGQNPHGGGSEKHEVNRALQWAVNRWAERHGDHEVIIWSGGGTHYAGHFEYEAFGGRFVSYFKDIRMPEFGDMVVDDQQLEVKECA